MSMTEVCTRQFDNYPKQNFNNSDREEVVNGVNGILPGVTLAIVPMVFSVSFGMSIHFHSSMSISIPVNSLSHVSKYIAISAPS